MSPVQTEQPLQQGSVGTPEEQSWMSPVQTEQPLQQGSVGTPEEQSWMSPVQTEQPLQQGSVGTPEVVVPPEDAQEQATAPTEAATVASDRLLHGFATSSAEDILLRNQNSGYRALGRQEESDRVAAAAVASTTVAAQVLQTNTQ